MVLYPYGINSFILIILKHETFHINFDKLPNLEFFYLFLLFLIEFYKDQYQLFPF